MPSGIKIKEVTLGMGAVAEYDKVAVVHVVGYLHRGEECLNTRKHGHLR